MAITDDLALAVRQRGFNSAVMRLAYERHFGLTRFADIPEGTVVLYRGEVHNRFRLLTKVSEVHDNWVGDDASICGSLMDWTNRAAVVFHFGPGENGVVKIFDAKKPLTEVMGELEIDKFILSMDGHVTPAGVFDDGFYDDNDDDEENAK